MTSSRDLQKMMLQATKGMGHTSIGGISRPQHKWVEGKCETCGTKYVRGVTDEMPCNG